MAPVPFGRRELILYEASRLFAQFGYHRTSTRDIAQAVGIRQPSLFHYFPTKSAIMEELLALNFDHALVFTTAMVRAPGSPAARLYRVIFDDLVHVTAIPYDLSSSQTDAVLEDPQFKPWLRKQEQLFRAVRSLIQQGIEAGQFQTFDPGVVQFIIVAVFKEVIGTIARNSHHRSVPTPEDAVAFMMRSILKVPESLDDVIADATAMAESEAVNSDSQGQATK